MRREGADPITSAAFYRAVVQALLLFGADTWVLSAATENSISGFHIFFAAGDGEMSEDKMGWDLAVGRSREHSEGGEDSRCT